MSIDLTNFSQGETLDARMVMYMKDKMGWEYVAYVVLNVLSFGSLWMMKIIIKKAILEAKSQ